MDEFSLIARHFAPLATAAGALSLTDDAAVLDIPDGHQLVATKDAMVEGVHYLSETAPADIARKLLRVNLSDLAAMGAAPLGVLLACAFPKDIQEDWIAAFAGGLGKDLAEFETALLGGDTVALPEDSDCPAVFSLTALGTVPAGTALTRGGAAAGDLVFVSGTLGDAAAGLMVLKGDLQGGGSGDDLATRHLLPEPRLALAVALRGVASAAIDVSDGLVADAGHIADVSKVTVEIEADQLPMSGALTGLALADRELLDMALTGGDDYELLFSAPADKLAAVMAAAESSGVPVTEIGRVSEGTSVIVRDSHGQALEIARSGWRHFRATKPETSKRFERFLVRFGMTVASILAIGGVLSLIEGELKPAFFVFGAVLAAIFWFYAHRGTKPFWFISNGD